MRYKYLIQFLMALVLWVLLAIILTSCNTAQRATRQTNKALFFHPEVVAKIARAAFPCIVNKSDTAIILYDTTIIADCPPANEYAPGVQYPLPFNLSADTLFWLPSLQKNISIPVIVKIPGRTITRTVEDSAKIKVMQTAIDRLTGDIDTLTISNRHKNKWLIYLGLFGLVNLVIYAFKIFVK